MTRQPVPAEEHAGDGTPMVVAESVGMTYPSRRGNPPATVLQDVSLQVARGECVVIVGPSGCGKSTLLSCLAGLTDHTQGSIRIDGHEIDGPDVQASVVFQHASLLPWRTVRRNVELGLEVRRDVPKAEIAERARAAIAAVGLTGFEDHYPHQVSGGMQQRANLARAFALRTPLILMDEPFGALDALTKESMQDELVQLMSRTSSSTVFITHDIREAIYLGDQILVMSARPGRILARFDSPFAQPRSREITQDPRFQQLETELHSLLDHR